MSRMWVVIPKEIMLTISKPLQNKEKVSLRTGEQVHILECHSIIVVVYERGSKGLTEDVENLCVFDWLAGETWCF